MATSAYTRAPTSQSHTRRHCSLCIILHSHTLSFKSRRVFWARGSTPRRLRKTVRHITARVVHNDNDDDDDSAAVENCGCACVVRETTTTAAAAANLAYFFLFFSLYCPLYRRRRAPNRKTTAAPSPLMDHHRSRVFMRARVLIIFISRFSRARTNDARLYK